MFHHPLYPSRNEKGKPALRKAWLELFDTYHVDLVLQGHDHAYLRTYAMKADKRVASPKEGTIYIVSNAGAKHYKQTDHAYIDKGMTKLSTLQVLDISHRGEEPGVQGIRRDRQDCR
jgi:acid phosphatase type 7